MTTTAAPSIGPGDWVTLEGDKALVRYVVSAVFQRDEPILRLMNVNPADNRPAIDVRLSDVRKAA